MTAVLMARPDQDVAPHSYVVLISRSHCEHCGTDSQHSQVFAKTHMKAQMGHKYVTNLRPVSRPSEVTWNLPIETQLRPVERLPFCHECTETASLAHLPSPSKPTNEQIAAKLHAMGIMQNPAKRTRWTDAQGREHYEEVSPATVRPKSKPFTIDDL